MKKISIFLSVIAFAVTSCAKNDLTDGVKPTKGSIEYKSYTDKSTKATEITNANFDEFQIYADQIVGGAFSTYYNEPVTKTGNDWGGTRPRKWPIDVADYLNFYAVNDFASIGDANFTKATDATNFASFVYTVPADATTQKDLLVAAAYGRSENSKSGILDLDFKHALTQIAFQVKSVSPSFEVKVNSITLSNVPIKGTFAYDGTENTVGAWTADADVDNYIFAVEDATNAPISQTYTTITSANGNLMLLPNADVSEVTMEIAYDIYKEGVKDGATLTKSFKLGDVVDAEGTPVAAIAWSMGKKLTYKLNLSGPAQEIKVGEATLTDWDATETEDEIAAKQVFGVSTLLLSASAGHGALLEVTDNRATQSSFTLSSNVSWVKFSLSDNDLANATATLDVNPLTKATTSGNTKNVYVYADFNDANDGEGNSIARDAVITLTREGYPSVTLNLTQAAADDHKHFELITTTTFDQTAHVEEMKVANLSDASGYKFTVKSIVPWMTFSKTGSGATSNSVVVSEADPTFFTHISEITQIADRSADITFYADNTSHGSVTITQNGPTFPVINNTNSGIIGYNAATGRMDFMGNTNIKDMLMFKYGGVIGQSADDPNTTAWKSSMIKFNPSNITNISSCTNVPTAGNTTISAGFQTTGNIAAGKGDPCRLVGLTETQIKGGLIDNKKFRLPTDVETTAFIATTYSDQTSKDGVKGRYLGTTSTDGSKGMFFPLAGSRGEDGMRSNIDLSGNYWTANFTNGTNAYRLFLYLTVEMNNAPFGQSFTVRCVTQ